MITTNTDKAIGPVVDDELLEFLAQEYAKHKYQFTDNPNKIMSFETFIRNWTRANKSPRNKDVLVINHIHVSR